MTSQFLKRALSISTLSVASLALAHADSFQTSIFQSLPPSGPVIPVVLTGVSLGANNFEGAGYEVTFAVPANEGVVKGLDYWNHVVPVAGRAGTGAPTYLAGDYGSATTSDLAESANYLSTGLGTITVNFLTPQYSLAFLWGSIDKGNKLTLNNSSNYTVTGSQVQSATTGFVSDGYQGFGGSAYVLIDTNTPFTTVTLSSTEGSFEVAGLAADAPSTPEPNASLLLGFGLIAIATAGLRFKRAR